MHKLKQKAGKDGWFIYQYHMLQKYFPLDAFLLLTLHKKLMLFTVVGYTIQENPLLYKSICKFAHL